MPGVYLTGKMEPMEAPPPFMTRMMCPFWTPLQDTFWDLKNVSGSIAMEIGIGGYRPMFSGGPLRERLRFCFKRGRTGWIYQKANMIRVLLRKFSLKTGGT